MIVDIREQFPEAISAILHEQGEPTYRGSQVFRQLHKNHVGEYRLMSEIPKPLRAYLEESYPIYRPLLRQRLVSKDGTKKYLFTFPDGISIESVLMLHKEKTGHIRHTVCLSTQAGCAMGCLFCATASMGFLRNLTSGEILSQVLEIASVEDTVIHNVVFMGMGEPLLNIEAVKRSIDLLRHKDGLHISPRRMTVSTCGLPDGIKTMASWDADVVLAVSLHGADDETRSRLMPVNNRYPLPVLLEACRDYVARTGKRITFEYGMIKGVNMGEDVGKRLADLLKGIPCNINLIPINPGTHGFEQANQHTQARFHRSLSEAGLSAVIRQERGSDIQGACGQLVYRSI